jgi:Icc protein
MQVEKAVLSWLHIGDLHITDGGAQNHQDLRRIVALAERLPPDRLDFAVLPGDNADDGTAEQFALVRDAVARLHLQLHILPGDHDFKLRSLAAFYEVLGTKHLPYAITAKGHRRLFLDVVSAGSGGPAFRLGEDQLAWTERELKNAEAARVRSSSCTPIRPTCARARAGSRAVRPTARDVRGHGPYPLQ